MKLQTPSDDTVKNPVIIHLFFENNHLIETPIFLILRSPSFSACLEPEQGCEESIWQQGTSRGTEQMWWHLATPLWNAACCVLWTTHPHSLPKQLLPWMILSFLGTHCKAGGVWNVLILLSQQNINHRVPPVLYDYFTTSVLHGWPAKEERC